MTTIETRRLVTGADIVGNVLSNTQIGLAASTLTSPANPTGTTSTTAVMMGLAIAFTPSKTGIVKISITGLASNATAADGATAQIAYGTGTAPANGAAKTGTVEGSLLSVLSSAAAQNQAIAMMARVSGLTVGTAIWVDLQVAAVTGGTSSVTNLTVVIEELLA